MSANYHSEIWIYCPDCYSLTLKAIKRCGMLRYFGNDQPRKGMKWADNFFCIAKVARSPRKMPLRRQRKEDKHARQISLSDIAAGLNIWSSGLLQPVRHHYGHTVRTCLRAYSFVCHSQANIFCGIIAVVSYTKRFNRIKPGHKKYLFRLRWAYSKFINVQSAVGSKLPFHSNVSHWSARDLLAPHSAVPEQGLHSAAWKVQIGWEGTFRSILERLADPCAGNIKQKTPCSSFYHMRRV